MNLPQLKAVELTERSGLDDWRMLYGCLVGTFRAASFSAATAFGHQIALAADEADHHPDIDIRYPNRVRVALTTHASGGITELDVELAGTISMLAATAGVGAEPTTAQMMEIAIDTLDLGRIRPFWKAVLGYADAPADSDNGQLNALVDLSRSGPSVWFQTMDAPRPQRSRTHLDVFVAADAAPERLAAAIAAGGRLLTDEFSPSFWVLADAEGNEACICTCEDR